MRLFVLLLAAMLPLSACIVEPDHDRDGDRVVIEHHDRDHDRDRDRDRDHDRHCDRDRDRDC